jgi:hypothetical protein
MPKPGYAHDVSHGHGKLGVMHENGKVEFYEPEELPENAAIYTVEYPESNVPILVLAGEVPYLAIDKDMERGDFSAVVGNIIPWSNPFLHFLKLGLCEACRKVAAK